MVGPAHVGTFIKDGTEVKMVATHMFAFFQSCGNLELQVLQILKQAHTERDIKQAYYGNKHKYTHRHKTSIV